MTVYLNGAFLPISEAKVSVLDRGFIYGDGVYEVVPVYAREPYRLRQHLARLQRSLDGIRLANPHRDTEWEAIIRDLIARQPFEDQGVYFQVTRGVAKRDQSRHGAAVALAEKIGLGESEILQQADHVLGVLLQGHRALWDIGRTPMALEIDGNDRMALSQTGQ